MSTSQIPHPTTQRTLFAIWIAELMRLVDLRTQHAHRHLIQPKDAEDEARDLVINHARRRLASQHSQTEWFAEWLQKLITAVDGLATIARQSTPGSPAVSRARSLVEHLARLVPGDIEANTDYQFISVVYRLGPEDSITELLEHHCHYTHASGNSSSALHKVRSELARAESRIKEMERAAEQADIQWRHLDQSLGGAIAILQRMLLRGQSVMPEEESEVIHDFFKRCNGSNEG